ncbi:hypothetical protein BH10BDE1_BH10BDE1_27620 [soil metagenome]
MDTQKNETQKNDSQKKTAQGETTKPAKKDANASSEALVNNTSGAVMPDADAHDDSSMKDAKATFEKSAKPN